MSISKPSTSKPDRLLIVDDEAYIREVLVRWLKAEGYECESAGSGDEALDALQRNAFSLVISDILMPGMSGVELLGEIKRSYPHVAVIMVTAVDERQTAIKSLELGAYAYIIKPFDQNEVIINVINALRRRELEIIRDQYEHRLEDEVRQRTTDVRRREEEIALRLVWASEYRDEETGSHVRRIGLYAELLAQCLGWTASAREMIRLAGPMHDIGKIGVPDHILLKPGKLSDEEFEIMKGHTTIGAGILEGTDVSLLHMAKDIALSHHEKWDGTGYPQGLSRDDIPKPARLVAVADVWDALTNDRVYRRALPEREALEIIRHEDGKHFDPEVVDCFLKVLPEVRRIREHVEKKNVEQKSADPA